MKKKHNKQKPVLKEFTMVFSEAESAALASALSYTKEELKTNLLTAPKDEWRHDYAEMAHKYHVLEGYIRSFGLSETQWAKESALFLWQDNNERERF